MPAKADVLEQLGETALLLPELVNRGLAANDRIKYFLTLLQGARAHAEHPDSPASSLQTEREVSGVDDMSFDAVVAGSAREGEQRLHIPHAPRIHALIVDNIREMVEPLTVAAAPQNGEGIPSERWNDRLKQLLASLSPPETERVPVDYVNAVTRADRESGDSLHVLLMDLHRELNRLQTGIASESVDGAQAYGLTDPDRLLVAAFMAGVNATAPLKFDHPGLGTTATRVGDRLVIQNDIGTTDAHVLVIHVAGLNLTVTYTDVHATRLQFFQGLLAQWGFQWTAGPSAQTGALGYELSVGQVTSKDIHELEERLTGVGSRLVFLIDWNRARKRLSRFLKKTDAIAVLKWAAEQNVGHRAFLQLGDVRLVYTAMERAARPQIRYRARLDEILGRESAQTFLQAVLTISLDGVREGKSVRLVQDEIQAELLTHFQSSEQGALNLAIDHAMLITGLAELVRDALLRFEHERDSSMILGFAARAKAWETRADDLVRRARTVLESTSTGGVLSRLLAEADDAADGLEEAAFLLTLMPPERTTRKGVEALRDLTELIVRGTQEYVKSLECAHEAHRLGSREEVEAFLVAVDAVIAFEHTSDDRERTVQAVLVETCRDFRELHVLSEFAGRLGDAADSLAGCALILRDHILESLKTH